jgi:hypothetical protein
VSEYEDRESERKSERAGFQQLLPCRTRRPADSTFSVHWSLESLTSQGTLPPLRYVETLQGCGVCWLNYTEPRIDSAAPLHKVTVSLLASLAQQKQFRKSEQIRAALPRVKQDRTRSGRSIGRPLALFGQDRLLSFEHRGFPGGMANRENNWGEPHDCPTGL